jgi:hypothetical protein
MFLRWLVSAGFVASTLVAGAVPTASVAPAAPQGARPAVTCDGTWHIVKTPVTTTHATTLHAVGAASATDAWAVGSDNANPSSGYPHPRIEHWDGVSWSIVKAPLPSGSIGGSLQGVAVISSTNVWAVGWYKDVNAVDSVLVEHWNGSAWKLVSTGLLGTNVSANAVVAISARDIWLVGIKGASPRLTFTAHWDGAKWKTVTSANQNGSVEDFLYGVSASSSTNVWAVGSWTDSSTSHGLIERWDGVAWKVVKSKAAFTLNGTAAISGSNAWAAGYDAAWSTLVIEHWNGTSWNLSLPPPTSEPTVGGMAAAASDDVWLAATTFGTSARSVFMAHWDGGGWVEVPSQTPATQVAVEMDGVAVTSDGGTAFAVGVYSKADDLFTRSLAEIWC